MTYEMRNNLQPPSWNYIEEFLEKKYYSFMSNTSGSDMKDLAFIICPIGDAMSPTRRNSDGLNAAVLKPILLEYFNSVQAPLDLLQPGSITSQVIILLNTADLVVANLTGLNPNVMYELAVRHGANKPVILLAEEGTQMPFDLLVERTIFYSNDMAGAEKLKPELRNAIESIHATEHDNPIYRALGQKLITEMTTGDDKTSMILKKIVELENSLSNFVNSNNLLNTPLLPERSIGEILFSNEIRQQIASLKQERVLTLTLSKESKITKDQKNMLIESLNSSPWKFISEIESANKIGNEVIIKAKISSNDLMEFEKYLSQLGYKVSVKFPGLYTI